jgi:hypothetical protein
MTLGVAVVAAGMAGCAHAPACRTAPTAILENPDVDVSSVVVALQGEAVPAGQGVAW